MQMRDQVVDVLRRGKPVAPSDGLVADTWRGYVDNVSIDSVPLIAEETGRLPMP